MAIRPEEITSILERELQSYTKQIDEIGVGTVLQVGDGIARVFGLQECMVGEMLEFLDGHGNPINKRNAWSARDRLYTHVIPPGAADTVHYRLRVPKDCGSRVTLPVRKVVIAHLPRPCPVTSVQGVETSLPRSARAVAPSRRRRTGLTLSQA